MKKIKINSKKFGTKYVLVDDEDYEWLNGFTWFIQRSRYGIFRVLKSKTSTNEFRYIYRMILNITDPNTAIDHIDRNTFNNQRNNLRICTHSQSACNVSSARNSSSKYLGVSLCKTGTIKSTDVPVWEANITKDYKKIHLGRFVNEKDAAVAYNNAAIKLHGEFASLNKV